METDRDTADMQMDKDIVPVRLARLEMDMDMEAALARSARLVVEKDTAQVVAYLALARMMRWGLV